MKKLAKYEQYFYTKGRSVTKYTVRTMSEIIYSTYLSIPM